MKFLHSNRRTPARRLSLTDGRIGRRSQDIASDRPCAYRAPQWQLTDQPLVEEAGRSEMRRPGARMTGSAYFPERYWAHLIELALDILWQRQLPTAVLLIGRLPGSLMLQAKCSIYMIQILYYPYCCNWPLRLTVPVHGFSYRSKRINLCERELIAL